MPGQLAESILTNMRDWRLRCPVCEDVIGVYEPIIVLQDGVFRGSSLLNEPILGDDQILMHRDCALNLPSPPPER